MNKIILLAITCTVCFQMQAQKFTAAEISKWKQEAQHVTIIRDNWGIPHVYGNRDADAVFGLLYAQCEDDFPRVEANYIEKLGRQSEVQGSTKLYEDLLNRLVLDSAEAKRDFANAPAWLKKLCIAFADGVNFYLYKHPETKPALLNRFQPWWPLMWTDGSIGAISTGGATMEELQSFYSNEPMAMASPKLGDDNELGSNGFAFAPKRTASGKAILYINPHVTLYFRPEVHMVSNEGLNAYGAVTWGQFFVYQGFNEHCGWMHTSSQADVSDLYAEKISSGNGQFTYTCDGKQRQVLQKKITLNIANNSSVQQKQFTAYYTHHGPVIARRDGAWLALKHHNRSMQSLIQSWMRTKAKSFAEFNKVMAMRENTSNNTVYADKEGNIAYWHSNFMPKRNAALDWSQPVDGSTSATEWQGLHKTDETVHLLNPESGWIQNCNSTPFTSSGSSSPKKENYPAYMAPDAENFRGINAAKIWSNADSLTLEKVTSLAYTRYLPAFEKLLPSLLRARKQSGFIPDSIRQQLDEALSMLEQWDLKSDARSVPTTLAVEWAQHLLPAIQKTGTLPGTGFVEKTFAFSDKATAAELLQPFILTLNDLKSRFQTWKVPWGETNRYQRLTGKLQEIFDDRKPSLPVNFAAATWGALPSYVSKTMNGSIRRYGVSGNSFICAVEFGDKVKAKSLLAGGNSNNPSSKHFADQADMYANGRFKDVLYYKADVIQHAERTYKPGN